MNGLYLWTVATFGVVIIVSLWRQVRALRAVPLLVTLAGLTLLTLVCDNVIVGANIVNYDPNLISGVKFLSIPVEDVTYSVLAAFLIPAVWLLLGKSKRKSDDD